MPNPEFYDEGNYCFESDHFGRTFPHRIILTSIIRQRDPELINVVSQIYHGELTQESQEFIRKLSRPLEALNNEGEMDSVKLFSKNEFVDDCNRDCILEYPGQMYEYLSKDYGYDTKLSTLTVQHCICLKKGCPVTSLRNLSSSLVNGLCGTIDEEGPVIRFPTLNVVTRVPKVKFSGKENTENKSSIKN